MIRLCPKCGFETANEVPVCPHDGTLLTPDPLLGTVFLEKYEIAELIGRGGMSAVYKARHILMDRLVAIKILKRELVTDNSSLLRFQQESKAVSLLQHPNVVNVFDFGVTSDGGVPYLIMDYLEGRTVSAIISQEGQINAARCVFLFSRPAKPWLKHTAKALFIAISSQAI